MKKIKFPLLIFLLSLLPFLTILINPLIFHTHDGPVHWARMAAWYKAVEDGQIPPRWASELNYGYGNAILTFIYPVPYFLSYWFLKFGLSLATTFKIVIFLSFLFSGTFMFLAAKELLASEKKAFLVAIFYQFASFRFQEMIVRGAFGEVFTYTFAPLILLGLAKIFHGQANKGLFIASVGTSLLILTHNSVSLIFFVAMVLFAFFCGQNWRQRLLGLFSLSLGLGLAAFYWLPALWERKYTYGDLFMKDLYLEHFPTLKQLFFPNFLNQPWGWVGDVAVQIGLLPILGLLLAIWLLIKKSLPSKEKRIFIFSLIIFLGCLFIMQPISLPLWQRVALLRQFQFSWRLLSLVSLITAFLSISFATVFKKKARPYWLLLGLVILFSVPFWRPTGFDQIDEDYYWDYPLNTTYFGEVDTIWAAGIPDDYPNLRVEIVEGEGEIKDFFQKSTLLRFQVEAKSEVNVLDRTFFFPGWRVFIDGREGPIQFQDPNHRGLITFRLSPGRHQVEIRFTRTKDRRISEAISLISLGILILFILFFQKYKKVAGQMGKRLFFVKKV